jgi:beta-glucosidase
VERPLRKLAAFSRVSLQPGETRQVEWAVPAEQLAIWDVTRERFCLEAANYTFMAGGSSVNIQVQATIAITGETIPPRDLSQLTAAANYDDYEGVYLDESGDGGTTLRLSGLQGWISFADVDLTKGARVLEAFVHGGVNGGELAIGLTDAGAAACGPAAAAPKTVAAVEASTAVHDQQMRIELSGQPERQRGNLHISLSGSVSLSRIRLTNV